jgi:hypothetical protein
VSSPERIADAGVALTGAGWIVSVAVEALPVVQVVAGIVAIIAGCCAAYYHLFKAPRR